MPKPRGALREVMRVLPGDEPPSEFLVFWPGENRAADGVPAVFDDEAAERVMTEYRTFARGIDLTFGHTRESCGECALEVRRSPVDVVLRLDEQNQPVVEKREGPSLWAVDAKYTSDAATAIIARKLRYISAVFPFDQRGHVAGLRKIGLTNDPATYGAKSLMQLEREYQLEREHGESLQQALDKIGRDTWPDASTVYVSDIMTTDEVVYNAMWTADDGSPSRDEYYRAPFAVDAAGNVTLTAQPVAVERRVEYYPLAETPAAVEAQAIDRSMTMNFLEALTAALMAAYADAVVKAPTAAYITTADGQNLLVPFDVAEDGTVTLGEAIPVSVGAAEQVAAAQRELNERLETLSREHAQTLETARSEGQQAMETERQKVTEREQALSARDGEMRKVALELGLHNGTIRVAERSLAEKWDLPTILNVVQKGAKQFTAERDRATPPAGIGDTGKAKPKGTAGRFVNGVLRFD